MSISATTRGLRPGVCTSSTRPSSPYDGQLIYETDTNRVAVYDTNAWVYKTPDTTTGSVLQVVSTIKTDSFTTTSLSFVDVTGFSVSITPKFSSSKILVLVTMTVGSQNTSNAHRAKLLRDSTDIAIGDAAGSRTRVSFQDVTTDANQQSFSGVHVLDSPNTTSAVTYKVQVSSNVSGQTVGVNRSKTDTDAATVGRSASTITVMEIAG